MPVTLREVCLFGLKNSIFNYAIHWQDNFKCRSSALMQGINHLLKQNKLEYSKLTLKLSRSLEVVEVLRLALMCE